MEKKTQSPRRVNFDDPNLAQIDLNDKQKPSEDSICWQLWLNAQNIAQEAWNSDFIQGIAHGTLDPAKYGQYTVQDCAYCFNGTADYKAMEQRANEMKLPEMAAFAKARWASYESYYESEAKSWHVKSPEALQVSQAAAQYIQSEHYAATKLHPVYGLIAMIPCDLLWPWLAEKMDPQIKQSGLYSFWVTENLGFGGAYRLCNFIDDWFAHNQEVYNKELAEYVFNSSMYGEANFFRSGCGQPLLPVPTPPNS